MRKFFLVVLLALSGIVSLSWALQPHPMEGNAAPPRTTDQILLHHADSMFFNSRMNPNAQFFVGHVHFEHNGAHMYCDSALYYREDKSFDAYGHVRMIQGDTLSLTCRTLYYKGAQQLAQAREGVRLTHRGTVLESENLDYDRLLDVGQYMNGGKLTDKDNQLTSQVGFYHPNTRESEFLYDVKLVNPLPPANPEYVLQSDTLYYNTYTKIAHVLGYGSTLDKLGDNNTTHIYTENGVYNAATKQAYLLDTLSLVQFDYKTLQGDSLHYDGAKDECRAFGHIKYLDRENKNIFRGHYALYNDSVGYAEAADSALYIDFSQADTLYAHADTFKLYSYHLDTDSVYRVLHAYPRVRAYRVDIQGVCDSLVYDGRDTCATMYKDPIIWQGTQQVLGEQIKAWFNENSVDSVHVINQALMVEQMDTLGHYNQVASTLMRSYFREGEVYLNVADLNVYLNYFPYDSDSLMIGMVHAESSQLRMEMENRKLQRIWMPATTGEMYPLTLIPSNRRYVQNFVGAGGELAWFDYIRPRDKDDLFLWRGKRSGTELKETVRHEAPTLKLETIRNKQKKEVNKEDTKDESL